MRFEIRIQAPNTQVDRPGCTNTIFGDESEVGGVPRTDNRARGLSLGLMWRAETIPDLMRGTNGCTETPITATCS